MDHSPGRHLSADYPDRTPASCRGDPHPGNLFLLPDGRWCFHDFGIVGRLSPRDRENLSQLFLAVIARDTEWLAAAYLAMGGAAPDVDRAAFTRDMGEALEQYYAGAADQTPSFAEIVNQLRRLSQRYQLRILRQFLLAFRAFIIVESEARDLDTRFNMLATLQAFTPQLLARKFLPDMTGAFPGIYRTLFTLRRTLTGLPVSLTRALQQLTKGELTVTVANAPMEEISQHLDRAGNRLSLSLIIAAVIIGSSLVMAVHSGPHYLGIPLLGLIGYSVASVLCVWWVIAILRSGKL